MTPADLKLLKHCVADAKEYGLLEYDTLIKLVEKDGKYAFQVIPQDTVGQSIEDCAWTVDVVSLGGKKMLKLSDGTGTPILISPIPRVLFAILYTI